MNIPNQKEYESNALILLLFLFQYGLLLPFTIILKGQIAIMIFTFVLLLYVVRRIKISTATVFLFSLPLLLLLFKLPFEEYSTDINVGLEMLYSYLTIGVSGILIGTLPFSYEKFLSYGYRIAWLNFILIFFIPYLGIYNEDINYMRFGYSLLPTVFFSFHFFIHNSKDRKKYGALILFIASFAELLMFGARGATFTFLVFVLLLLFFYSEMGKTKKILLIASICLTVAFLPIILNYLNDLLGEYNIYSYPLTKLINYLEGQDIASTSSGRDDLYEAALSRIYDSPIFGSPISSCYIDTGATYYHNIFLDIIVNFGYIVFLIFVLFLSTYFYRAMRTNNNNSKVIFLIILLLPMARLIVSSSFWQRPDFWFFMSYCINNYKLYRERQL